MSASTCMSTGIAILGGGYAGVLAALRLARRGRQAGRITLINAVPHFVERIRLHQLAAGQSVPERPLAELLAGSGVELLVGRAVALDPRAQRIEVAAADGTQKSVPWDYLLYALGSGLGPSQVPGVAEHAHSVASEPAARRLATRLSSLPPGGRVAVVGGGLTGIETATELAESHPHLRISLFTGQALAPGLSPGGSTYIRESLAALGVLLHENSPIDAVEQGALTLRGGTVPTDLTIWCAGFAPASLAAASGLATNGRGQLLVGADLRVPGHPGIFGCGDGAGFADAQAPLRMACATAMPMGAHAADSLTALLAGRSPRPFGFAFFAQCISLGRRRGIVQRVAPDDRPGQLIVTDRLGARLKEAVCRFTVLALSIERRFAGTYRWPGRGRPRGLAAPTQPQLLVS